MANKNVWFLNPEKNQESISWVINRLNCNTYTGKNGQLIFLFKNYLVNYIQSIVPNFDENDIEEASYITADVDERYAESAGASILTKSAKASSELQKILHDRSVSDMFPGKLMKRFLIWPWILGWNFDGLETGKLSAHCQRASVEELLERRPVWIGQYEESISIEALRTRESYEESTDDLFFGPSWARRTSW